MWITQWRFGVLPNGMTRKKVLTVNLLRSRYEEGKTVHSPDLCTV